MEFSQFVFDHTLFTKYLQLSSFQTCLPEISKKNIWNTHSKEKATEENERIECLWIIDNLYIMKSRHYSLGMGNVK